MGAILLKFSFRRFVSFFLSISYCAQIHGNCFAQLQSDSSPRHAYADPDDGGRDDFFSRERRRREELWARLRGPALRQSRASDRPFLWENPGFVNVYAFPGLTATRTHTEPTQSFYAPDYTQGRPIDFTRPPNLEAAPSRVEAPIKPQSVEQRVDEDTGFGAFMNIANLEPSSAYVTPPNPFLEWKLRKEVLLPAVAALSVGLVTCLLVANYSGGEDKEAEEAYYRKIQQIQAQSLANRIKALQLLAADAIKSIQENKNDADTKVVKLNEALDGVKLSLQESNAKQKDALTQLQKLLDTSIDQLKSAQAQQQELNKKQIESVATSVNQKIDLVNSQVANNQNATVAMLAELTKQLATLNENYEHLSLFVHSSPMRRAALSWILEDRSPDLQVLLDFLVEEQVAQEKTLSKEDVVTKLNEQAAAFKNIPDLKSRWELFKANGEGHFSSLDNDGVLYNFIAANLASAEASQIAASDFYIYDPIDQKLVTWMEEEVDAVDGHAVKKLYAFDPADPKPVVMSLGDLESLIAQNRAPHLVAASEWAFIYALSKYDAVVKSDSKLQEALSIYKTHSTQRGLQKAQAEHKSQLK